MGKGFEATSNDPMQVVYACDDAYAMLAGVSMESLYEANGQESVLNVYILSNALSDENKDRLREIASNHGREVCFVELDGVIPKAGEQLVAHKWSPTVYARLYAPQLLPDAKRILYLDCDTLVLEPLRDLWNMDLEGRSCAAVSEPFSALHKRNIGMKAEEAYYNSGVMIIDLEKWREEGALQHFFDVIARQNGHVSYPDQGVINEVYHGRIYTLPAKYNFFTLYCDFSYEETNRFRADRNVYSPEEVEAARKEPAIVHLSASFLTNRPWVEGSTHPFAARWEDMCEKTPWAGAPKWKDDPGTARRVIRWIFRHTPRPIGIWIAMLANSYVRPMLER